MDGSDPADLEHAKQVLDLLVAIIGSGAIGLTIVVVKGWRRFAYAGVIGVVSALLAATQLPAPVPTFVTLAILLGGAAAGLIVAGAILLVLRIWKKTAAGVEAFLAGIRVFIQPVEWVSEDERKTSPVATEDALARRWFVAIAAASGGIVGALANSPRFLESLNDSLQPANLLTILLLTTVSLVLIGPVHESILARRARAEGGDHETPRERAIAGELTWRSALRLGLVGVLLVAVELAYDSLGRSIKSGEIETTIQILVSGITPGVVSFYWSAALQIDGSKKRLCDDAVAGATGCVTVLYYAFGVLAAIAIGSSGLMSGSDGKTTAGAGMFILFSPVIGALIASLMAAAIAGLPTYAGGFVLARLSGWAAIAALGVVLCATSSVSVLLGQILLWMNDAPADWSLFGNMFGIVVGWMIGLIASGFPQLVMNARRPTADAAAAA